MSRGKIIALVIVIFFFVFAFYFWRDVNLANTVAITKIPDIVVENLNFRRTIESRDWHITAVSAEHDSGKIFASSVDVRILDLQDKRKTEMKAERGEFIQDDTNLTLRSLDGFVFLEDRRIDVKAPVTHYDASSDVWFFEKGLVVADSDTTITGNEATISNEGIFHLQKGAQAHWTIK